MIDIKNLTNEEIKELISNLQNELSIRLEADKPKYEITQLSYNQYKGSGKCWIARVDPETKKILGFLDAESRQPDGTYRGEKTFKIPLQEGSAYLFCESGSKSTDARYYRIVKNGKLERF